MTIEVRPLIFKPQYLNGLTEKLVVSHYENNYGGALRRLNAIEARIRTLDWATAPVFEINGLKREELIAAGSVILHEAYFDSLGGGGGDPPPGLGIAEALERDFGSVAAWTAEFTAMAKAQAGGSGWTTLVWSDRLGRLINQWSADHAHTLGGWRADPGARYVRTCLSPRFRHQGRSVCRCRDGQSALGTHRRALSPSAVTVRRRTSPCSRRSARQRRARC